MIIVPEDDKERPKLGEPSEPPPAPEGVMVEGHETMGRTQQLRSSMDIGEKSDPALSERVFKLQKKTGLPADLLERNIDTMEKAARARDFDSHKFYAESPIVAKWLADDPIHVAAAKEDVENLSYLERQWRHIRQSRQQGVRMVRASELGWKRLTGGLSSAEERELHEIDDLARGATDYGITGWFEGIPGAVAEQSEVFKKTFTGGATGAAALGAAGTVVGAAGGPLTSAVGLTAGVFFGWRIGAAWEAGKLESGLAYNDFVKIRDENGNPLEPEVVKGSAFAVGAVNASLEVVGMNAVVKSAPGLKWLTRGGAKKLLENPTTRAAFKEYAKNIAGAISGEGVTEGAQEFVKIVAQELQEMHGENRLGTATPGEIWGRIFSEENLAAMGESARKGTQAGGGMSAGMGSVGLAAGVRQARRADVVKKAFHDLGDNVKQLRMKESAPGRTRQVMDRLGKRDGDPMADDGPVARFDGDGSTDTVYIPARKWQEYFQGLGEDPEAAARELLGDNFDEYADALESDSDMAVSLADYADKVAGSEHNTFFQDEVKLSPEDMNFREKNELMEELDAMDKDDKSKDAPSTDEAQANEAEVQEIRDTKEQELIAAGTDPETAAAQAQLFGNMMGVMARRSGMSPKQLFGKRPVEVRHATEGVQSSEVFQQAVKAETKTPEFKKFYEGTHEALYDDKGEPLVLYKGLQRTFRKNQKEVPANFMGFSYFTDDPIVAEGYSSNILPAYVTMKNPLIVEANGGLWSDVKMDWKTSAGKTLEDVLNLEDGTSGDTLRSTEELVDMLREFTDYDGVILRNLVDPSEALGVEREGFDAPSTVVVAFDNKQVKAAFGNTGAFDPKSSDIFNQAAGAQTETKEFKSWFGDSKVVDEEGAPLVVHRGSESMVQIFTNDNSSAPFPSALELPQGRGFYFSDKTEVAGEFGGHITDAYLSITKPFVVDAKREAYSYMPLSGNPEMAKIIKSLGEAFFHSGERISTDQVNLMVRIYNEENPGDAYDGIVFKNVDEGSGVISNVFVAFKPNQVKSSTRNVGTFDPADPNIFKQRAEGVRGSFDRIQNIITLGSKMNRSTFLHESGHYFLELMGDIAAAPGASQDLRADYQKALEWMGVKDRASIGREQHEQFARGFEAYLRTGKAPNSELRTMFAKFRAWLTELYKSMRSLDVELSPEITGVFDRLVSTEQDLADAGADSLQPLFTEMTQSGMGDKQAFDYTAAVDRARRAAVEEMTERQMEDYDKEQRRLKSAERASVEEGVIAELQKEPVYIALSNMQKGTLPDGSDLPKGINEIKLRREDLVRDFGKDFLKTLPRPHIYIADSKDPDTPNRGVYHDIAAKIFGFSDGRRMLDEISRATPYKEEIAARADELMELGEPTIAKNREKAEEAAVKSIHNDKQAELYVKELKWMVSNEFAKFKALTKKISRPVPSVKDVKETAAQMLGKRKVRDIRPQTYRQASRNHGKMAMDAFLKGDFQQAFEHKRLQLLNHALFNEAVAARTTVGKYVNQAKRFQKKSLRQRIGKAGGTYMEQIDAILEKYSFKRRSLKAVDRLETLREWVEQRKKEGLDIDVPDKLLDESYKTNYQNAPLSELTDAMDSIKTIEHLARTKNKLLAARDKRSVEEAETEIVAGIEAHHKMRKEPYDYAPGMKSRVKSGTKAFLAEHTKMEFLFEILDGEEQGAAWNHLFKPLADAEGRESDIMREITERMQRIFSRYKRKERALWYYEKFRIPEIGTELNKANILAVALNQGNEYNRGALMEGNGWDQGQVDAILKKLDKRDWETVQDIWDLIDSLWPEVSKLERAMTGIVPPKVENKPIITPHGTFKGGYYPIIFDSRRDFRQSQLEEAQNVREMFGGNFARAMTKKGHTVARKGTGGKPISLELSGFGEHISAVVHDFTHRRAIVDVSKLAQRPKVREAIESAVGREYFKQINPWLSNIAGDRIREPSTRLDSVLNTLRKNATIANMGWKLTTIIVQPLGYTVSVKELGTKYALEGLKVFRNPIRNYDFMVERSAFMRDRMQNFDRDVRDSLKKLNVTGKQGPLSVVDSYTRGLTDTFLAGIGYADMAVSLPTWMGAYSKAMDGLVPNTVKGNELAAIDYADRTVRTSQGGGSAKDLAFIQSRERLKLFTMFYSYFSVLVNQYQSITHDYIRNKDVPKLFWALMWTWIIPVVLDEMVLGRPPEDEDDDEAMKRYAKKIALYPAQSIVGLRDVVSVFDGYGYSMSPVADSIDTLGRTAHNMTMIAAGEKDFEKRDLRSLFLAGGYMTGLPARQLWSTGDAVMSYANGDWAPEDPFEAVWGGLVTGPPRE